MKRLYRSVALPVMCLGMIVATQRVTAQTCTPSGTGNCESWCSAGIPPNEAFRRWVSCGDCRREDYSNFAAGIPMSVQCFHTQYPLGIACVGKCQTNESFPRTCR